MKTRISAALVAIGLSATAQTALAGYPSEQAPMPMSNDVQLKAPFQEGSWFFGIEGLYMEMSNNTLQYGSLDSYSTNGNVATDIDTTSSRLLADQDYDWGVRGDITYNFAGSNGRDVSLSYTHLDISSSSGSAIDFADFDVTDSNAADTSAITTPLGGNYNSADVVSDDNYDAVDLVFGQKN